MRKLSPILFVLALALMAVPALAQPSVTVNGPSSVTIVDTCENVSWTCSASGGTTPYVWYLWRRNGSLVSQGASATGYTRAYCNPEGNPPPPPFTDTISCTVTDSNGREGTGSKNTTITFQ
ncbi:MAG TPA: hypothetical protein VF756_12005 [Thermoanaerobaculia bacterium]